MSILTLCPPQKRLPQAAAPKMGVRGTEGRRIPRMTGGEEGS